MTAKRKVVETYAVVSGEVLDSSRGQGVRRSFKTNANGERNNKSAGPEGQVTARLAWFVIGESGKNKEHAKQKKRGDGPQNACP